RTTGALPATGELTTEAVRSALGRAPRPVRSAGFDLPVRLPRLCAGCPHTDSFDALRAAIGDDRDAVITSDIGCYALGALPPHHIADSLVCMGASVGMAMGAAQAGVERVVATIGDSTFLHSGVGALLDAAQANTPMTLIILDNETVAMTGGQTPAAPPERIEKIVLGLGVSPDHVVTLKPSHALVEENAAKLRQEIDYRGLSVVIARRSCIKTAKTARSSV
ncbi:MAG: indolepyruvate ferredoxin oxidoreductase, partial [Spirochaetaceae bacterium]